MPILPFPQSDKFADEIAKQNQNFDAIHKQLAKLSTIDFQLTKLGGIEGRLNDQATRLVDVQAQIEKFGGIQAKLSTLEEIHVQTEMLGSMQTQLEKLKYIHDQIGLLVSMQTKLEKLEEIRAQTEILGSIQTQLEKLEYIHDQTEMLGSMQTQLEKLEYIHDQMGLLGSVQAQLGKLEEIYAQMGILGDMQNQLGKLDSLSNQMGSLENVGDQLSKLTEVMTPDAPLRPNTQGPIIQDLQSNLSLLGLAIPQHEIKDQVYGPGTQAALLDFQARHGISTSAILDPSTKAALAEAVSEAGKTTYRVQGRVFLPDGQPARNLPVKLYGREFGKAPTAVHQVTTDDHGFYIFTYDPGTKPPNFEIRLVTSQGYEVALSAPKYNVTKNEVLNLVAPAGTPPQTIQSEYQRLTDSLAPHLNTIALAQAKENRKRQDLTYLNHATGWDARLIALAAITEKLYNDSEVKKLLKHKPVIYGLLRAGLPSDKQLLAQVEPDVIELALTKARDAGIVTLTGSEITQFKNDFITFANQVRLTMPVPGSQSSYDQFLISANLSEDARKKFTAIFLDPHDNAAQLWAAARQPGTDGKPMLTEAEIAKLQLHGKLAFLTGYSVGMTTRLAKLPIQDPVQLVAQGFHCADRWKTEARQLANHDDRQLAALIPAAYTGATVQDCLDAYAEDLARKVRVSYPTQVVAQQIRDGKEFKLPVAPAETLTLLNQAIEQGFRLGETPVAAFLKTHPGIVASKPAQQQLRMLQRIYQITPGNEAMPVLIALEITSAYDVMAYTQSEFIRLYERKYAEIYSGNVPPKTESILIYQKAQQVSSVTYNLFAIAKKIDGDVPVLAISGNMEQYNAEKSKSLGEILKNFPTLETLFGAMDYCECEHCRSVLSPAAYLVDLLQFIDAEPAEWNKFLDTWSKNHGGQRYTDNYKKPYDALIEHRPDLPHIPLTCENTHTALPYIDIVNEILEYYVANGKLEEEAAHDTGSATTAELLAEPHNVIRGAYDRLGEARYPLNLPFDLWIEMVREFCNYFGVPLAQVLDVLRRSDDLFAPQQPFDRSIIFIESLGLSPAEAAIFSDPDPLELEKWHELFGYPREDIHVLELLKSAKALSRRLGITYKEITEIIQTEFVNPELRKLSWLYRLGVSIQQAGVFQKNARIYAQKYCDCQDLLDKKDGEAWSAAEKQRLGEIGEKEWEILLELHAFKHRLAVFADEFKPAGIDAARLEKDIQAIDFSKLLILQDPDTGSNFDLTTLQYADGQPADEIVFLRINLFVRLWRKLGWSIAETDRALQTFVPENTPFERAHLARQPLKTALIYLAHLKTLDESLNPGKPGRLKLLTLWADIPTTGQNSLYARLFLTRGVLKSDPVFDHPFGMYLTDPNINLADHILTLQGALGLTAGEIKSILADAGIAIDQARLSIPNVSLLYRYKILAKALQLTVPELISLKHLSGLNPFTPLHPDPLTDPSSGKAIELDYPFSQTLGFVEVVAEVKESGLKIEDLEYLLRQRFDDTGKYRPDRDARLALLKSLSEGIRAIRAKHAIHDDPGALTDEVLIRQYILQTLTAQTEAAPELVESLITDPRLLSMADSTPLVDAFAKTGEIEFNAPSTPAVNDKEAKSDKPTNIELADRAATLLNKALQFVQSLGLSERELRYLLTHAADFEDVSLSKLPAESVGDTPDEKTSIERFRGFRRLVAYARLKRDLAGGSDDLIAIFEAGDPANAYPQIAKLTRRDTATVQATAEALLANSAVPAFKNELPLLRLWEALKVVERFGVPVASLVGWAQIVSPAATPTQRFEIARGVKEAIKARFEPETWQRVAQPIFDKLRQRQRDGLAAYVMHQHGFSRMEQLYEYFLIDPGMEPVVQTSRIRLAIASLQLFIQRCLLNMEPRVNPAVINSKQWEWMKRYRVWEANRKIFLFPENWLEPEFRDDKTHLFAELEGTLLQGDVSSDLVEDAFLNYLKKLDELARLEMVAMHIEDNHTVHVFGRTYTQPHKYFYRRYANQMWTPWEPVSAEIEGNHLAPVIWRDRLYLFWATFLDKPIAGKPVESTPVADTTTLVDTKLKQMLSTENLKQVEIQLHWSEYMQGRWSPCEASVPFPVTYVNSEEPIPPTLPNKVPLNFDYQSVFIHISKEFYQNGMEGGVYIHLGMEDPTSNFHHTFYLAGRNSAPERYSYSQKPDNPFNSAQPGPAARYSGTGKLKVSFQARITTEPGATPHKENPDVLQNQGGAYTLLPCDNALATPDDGEITSLVKPVFYQDNAHTLFVEPSVTECTIEEWQDWITRTPHPEPGWRDPEWWEKIEVMPEQPKNWTIPYPIDTSGSLPLDFGALINPNPNCDWLVNPNTELLFDGVLIGPVGQSGLEKLADEAVRTTAKGSPTQVVGGLNIIGGAGFNSVLSKNLSERTHSAFGTGMTGAGRIES